MESATVAESKDSMAPRRKKAKASGITAAMRRGSLYDRATNLFAIAVGLIAVVFVPVGLNYDRVLEDRSQLLKLGEQRRRRDVLVFAAVRGVPDIVYFLFFILMPWYTARDKVKPVPDRVTM